MKVARRQSRADALQILYLMDMNHELATDRALNYFKQYFANRTGEDKFCERLVRGVAEKLRELDAVLAGISENWRTDRMAIVDRNLLRMGTYELGFCDDIPSTVSINEMVELAKQFGSETSAAFVNGILDQVKVKLYRPSKAP
ncbi:MAG: transcription antitermination factor NusB [Deltaproteobacteria bacterium]|nr:transcription antitermination factor NusB [Deltaproteobacteria bacterium]